ncbi:MAG: sigma-54-dependent transcriptional regulator [Opitutales bacterium]
MEIEKILIVDDEFIIRRTLEEYCQRARLKVRAVGTIEEGLASLQGDHGFDLAFLDVNLPDGDGLEILEEMQDMEAAPLPVMITGQGSIESAVECMKLGAYDYLLKPFSTDQLDMILQRAAKYNRLVQVNKELARETNSNSGTIVGESPEIEQLKGLIDQVARTDATVLISGETGTGKELVAQSIHQKSLRRDKPFIRVNCAAVSETLIESEFFGHEKGAFTGAMESRIGRFELADGGTLLLDEISEVSLALQAKLLRALQEGELERVGGTRTIKVDVRILATTNRDLMQTVRDGDFREDLYYRLNVFPLQSPALRERRGDVRLLAQNFLQALALKHGAKCRDFSAAAYKMLDAHNWPGNVRELQNVVERAVILSADKQLIEASVLPLEMHHPSDDAAGGGSSGAAAAGDGEGGGASAPVVEPGSPVVAADSAENVDWSLEGMERKLILETLRKTGGKRSQAAELMQVSIRTLFNKLNQYKKKGYEEFKPYFNSKE